MEKTMASIIKMTDSTGLLSWTRYLMMNDENVNRSLRKSSLILCEKFMKDNRKFDLNSHGIFEIKAEIVLIDVLRDKEYNAAHDIVIIQNLMCVNFDELMLNFLRYDWEIPMEHIECILKKSRGTLQNTFNSFLEKYDIPTGDLQSTKSAKAQNRHKRDFRGGFLPDTWV
jgi:hypothetical protein